MTLSRLTVAQLTDRHLKALQNLVDGHTVQRSAHYLNASPASLNNLLQQVQHAVGATNRRHTPLMAWHHGLLAPTPHRQLTLTPLSGQQPSMLALLAQGRSNPEIGQQLAMSTHIVTAVIRQMNSRLHAVNPCQAVYHGLLIGLLNPADLIPPPETS